LEAGLVRFVSTPQTVIQYFRHDSAQLGMFKTVVETQINTAWFGLPWPEVPMEKPYWLRIFTPLFVQLQLSND